MACNTSGPPTIPSSTSLLVPSAGTSQGEQAVYYNASHAVEQQQAVVNQSYRVIRMVPRQASFGPSLGAISYQGLLQCLILGCPVQQVEVSDDSA